MGEVRSRAKTSRYVSGNGDTFYNFEGFSITKTIDRFLGIARQFLEVQELPAQLWLILLVHPLSLSMLVPGGRRRIRNMQFQLHSQVGLRSTSADLTGDIGRCAVVDGFRESASGSGFKGFKGLEPRTVPVHGCLNRRLASNDLSRSKVWCVVPSGEGGTHQSPGAKGHSPRAIVIRGESMRTYRSGSVRQHESCVVSAKGWRDEVSQAQPGCRTVSAGKTR